MTRAVILAMLALWAPAVALGAGDAAPTEPVTVQIFRDYATDGRVDGAYAPSDLRAAIHLAQKNGLGFAGFQDAVQTKLEHDVLGSSEQTAGPPVPNGSLLPEPVQFGSGPSPPWPLLVSTGLGGLLLILGCASAIVRRHGRGPDRPWGRGTSSG